jgi:hypothetical protein
MELIGMISLMIVRTLLLVWIIAWVDGEGKMLKQVQHDREEGTTGY